jgi:hypothetical protein
MAKRTPYEDMTPEQRERSDRQKRAIAEKKARRHTHPGEEQTEHDYGIHPHAHGPDGVPRFENAPTEAVAPPEALTIPTTSTTAPLPSFAVTEEQPMGAVSHQHENGMSHTHLEGQRLHRHSEVDGHPVFLDKTDAEKTAEHSSAIEEARKADVEASVAIPQIEMPVDADVVLTVMSDGYTVLGKTWYQGEEIRLKSDNPLGRDNAGHGFWEMPEDEQIERYGRVMFKLGPAGQFFKPPGPSEEDEAAAIASGDPEKLRRIEKARQRAAGPPGRELVASGPSGVTTTGR